ncbi:hypothetical protein D3C74_300160 [compost metagenome]
MIFMGVRQEDRVQLWYNLRINQRILARAFFFDTTIQQKVEPAPAQEIGGTSMFPCTAPYVQFDHDAFHFLFEFSSSIPSSISTVMPTVTTAIAIPSDT